MSALFVYGTLCLPAVRDRLLRRQVPVHPATLDDHRVARVAGHTYPTLVPDPGHRAAGLLLNDLSDAEHAVLRGFEPPVYELVAVTVVLTGEGDQPAVTFRRRDAADVAREPWSPDTFEGAARSAFLDEVAAAADALWAQGRYDLDGRTAAELP